MQNVGLTAKPKLRLECVLFLWASPPAKYWPITFFAICDHIKITCSKSDLRSDQDHDLEFSQKVIGDKIVILDHFLGRSLWIFFPQFSELRFGFNIVVWVLFLNNSSFLCIFQVRIFDLRLLIKDSNFYWLCQVLSLESDTRLCIKKLELFRNTTLSGGVGNKHYAN